MVVHRCRTGSATEGAMELLYVLCLLTMMHVFDPFRSTGEQAAREYGSAPCDTQIAPAVQL